MGAACSAFGARANFDLVGCCPVNAHTTEHGSDACREGVLRIRGDGRQPEDKVHRGTRRAAASGEHPIGRVRQVWIRVAFGDAKTGHAVLGLRRWLFISEKTVYAVRKPHFSITSSTLLHSVAPIA